MRAMRETLLSRADLVAAVFIGGMDGVENELAIFQRCHPNGLVAKKYASCELA